MDEPKITEYEQGGKKYRLIVTNTEHGTFEKTEIFQDGKWQEYDLPHPMVNILKWMKDK